MHKRNDLQKGQPVCITWVDSASFAGWRTNTLGIKTGKIVSIGFVVDHTDEGIILATSLGRVPEVDEPAALDPVIIPHGCIAELSLIDLTPAPDDEPMPAILTNENRQLKS